MSRARLFWEWVKHLDRLLRGQTTSLPALRQGRIDMPVPGLSVVLVLLGVIYGFCMGWFALFNRQNSPQFNQLLASMVKVPMLFFLTLVVTFPSLYIFNALVGSRLNVVTLVKLLIAAMGVTLAVLASFGTIVAFFSVTTTSYPFIVLLNVLIFAVAGLLGLFFLLRTLHRLSIIVIEPAQLGPADLEPAGGEGGADASGGGDAETGEGASADQAQPPGAGACPPSMGALDRLGGQVLGPHERMVFRCWMVIFALVGSQMSWVLRPFIGHPKLPFTFFRPRHSNFFQAVWETIFQLFK